MLSIKPVSYVFTAILVALDWGSAQAGGGVAAAPVGIAVEDFAYVDTSGEAADQVAVHTEQLQAFMVALRQDFERQSTYRLVSVACVMACMDAEVPDLVRAASAAGARIVVMGGIHKMSTLVQWARVQAIDVDANRMLFDRLFTFRGDNSQAWSRAEAFVFREIQAGLVGPVLAVGGAVAPEQ